MSENTSHQASSSLHFNIELKTEYASDTEYADGSLTCRVCLQEGDIPIFSTQMTNDIVEGLLFFGTIIVEADDAFPKFMCKKCYELLQGAILLRKTAQQSDEILRRSTKHENRIAMEISEVKVESQIVTNEEAETKEMVFKSDEESEYELKGDETTMLRRVLKRMKLECQKCNLSFKTYTQYKEHVISEEHSKTVGRSIVNCEPPVAEDNDDEDDDDDTECAPEPDKTVKLTRFAKRKIFICKRCDKKFKTYEQFNKHKLSEEHNKPVPCPVCKKVYNPRYLGAHVRRHTVKRKPQFCICDVCGYQTNHRSSLDQHRLIHTDKLPFHCAECPYKARSKTSLTLHLRVHTGERPYPCQQCPAKFVSKSNLNKHMLTHKKTRDFICDLCGKGYLFKPDLEEHIKAEHYEIKEHVCNICNKSYGYRKQMMKHQRRVHKRAKLQGGRKPIYLLLEKEKEKANGKSTFNS